MRGVDRHRAASRLEVGLNAVSQTLAVVVIGIGDRNFVVAFRLQDFRHDLALTRIGRRRAEEKAIVLNRRQRRRGCGWRDHDRAVGDGDVRQNGGGHAGTVSAHDGCDAFRGDQTLSRGSCGRGVDAGAVSANRRQRLAAQEGLTIGDLLHRQLSAGAHGGGHRFNRAGKAQKNADFHGMRSGVRRAGHGQRCDSSRK